MSEMFKPYKITKLDNNQDISKLDDLITNLYKFAQNKEHTLLTFATSGTWLATDDIKEKYLVLAVNTADNEYRLYTKINGQLKYLTLS